MALTKGIRAAKTIVEVYRLAAELYGERPAFCPRLPDGSYGSMSFRELFETGCDLAAALIELGVAAREHVAILADNRLEWVISDCAILAAGANNVPRGTDITAAEIDYILNHADVRVVLVDNGRMLEKFLKHRGRVPGVEHVIVMDREAEPQRGVLRLWDLVERGRQLRAEGDRRLEERMQGVAPDDLFTLIYTSGTTGRPKGVQLTHANMVSQIRNLPIDLGPDDRLLSILPIWHIYERVALMVSVAYGATTYYTSIRTIADDLKTVRPTLMLSAPRLWENLYQKIIHSVHKQGPLKQAMFRIAYFFSWRLRRSAYFVEGRRIDLVGRPLWYSFLLGCGHAAIYLVLLIPYLVMDGLVTRKLRAILGGAFRGTVSGGGALQPHVDEFFNYIGIPVLEGYGLTETCPVLAVRTWKKRVIGTVGPVWPETELRIVDLDTHEVLFPDPKRKGGGRGLRGEIQVRGPQVMKGYYKEPELTAQVMKDGWFATGDIGIMTYNDCLRIVGRCKETIVLLSGENVEPTPIENKLTESPYIDKCMVVGQDQKHLAALIVTRPENFRDDGIEIGDPAELPDHPEVKQIIAREIKALVNARTGFRHFEMIHGWRIVPKPFEVGDELTSTYKLKRQVITQKYAGLIAEIYHVGNQSSPPKL